MDFNKGNWNPSGQKDAKDEGKSLFDLQLERDAAAMLDDKVSSKIVNNFKKHMVPEYVPRSQLHAPPAGGAMPSSAVGGGMAQYMSNLGGFQYERS